ncbi:peptidoglycan-binding domain-containing protein [Streptomyces sp. DT2A-34]|uniref:peptidoglycan-binding domain-containing protein n=1 Tax=Streptomyces sp. DT2A-34 TaxID=3051182 RepID=UPI00265BB3D9|nr:peptidoglycan-binding domain-containing protein [Streptomyces sp. DT2A-34]MDO0913222.1 peptidoglycan-binding domain-containing protein [Streptomyces sp. DT2A-34]
MNFGTTRTRLAAAVAAAVATGALAVSASPASATSSQGYFTGYGTTWTDDWSNEGTLSSSSYARSNATCLWQKILWAEGATESNGTAYDSADIDGIFGSNTTYATKRLQTRWGLDDDGLVGPQTLSAADNKLRYSSGSTSSGTLTLTYDGISHDFTMTRSDSNQYRFYQEGVWRLAGYNYRSCS